MKPTKRNPNSTTPSLLATAIALALCALPFVAAAVTDLQEDDAVSASTLERVEVRGQAMQPLAPLALDDARARLRETAGATGVVDGEAYRDGRVGNLSDALKLATGVFSQPRFGADEARVSIRGSGLQRTFHGRGIQVLQDGAPINLADGGFDMQSLEPLAARYIEVWRGANALEYGAATLGGAINFVSLTGADVDGARARAELGSFGYSRGQVILGGSRAQADGMLSLSGAVQDGYRDNARQETYRLFANAGRTLGRSAEARVYLTHVDTRSALPGSLSRAQFQADPRQAAAGSVALDQRRDFVLNRLGLRLAGQPAAGREWVASAYYAAKSLDHPIFQVLLQDTDDYGVDLRYRIEPEAGRGPVWVFGASANQGDTEDERFVNRGNRNPAGRRGALTGRADQTARNLAAFAEWQQPLSERLTLVAGAQALRAERESSDRFQAGGVDRSFQRTYSGVSPKLGLRVDLDAGVQLFTNLSRSLEPPSFGELAGGPDITQVDAQRADTFELGTRVTRAGFDLDAAVYRAWVRDELLSLSDAQGNPLGTVNAPRTLHQGVELGVGRDLGAGWRVAGSALVNDFRFDADPVYGGNRLGGVPLVQVRSTLRWAAGQRLYVEPGVEWVPGDYYVDHANSFTAPGYAIASLKLGGRVGASWDWFVDARNLTDRAYVSTTGVVADARGLDGAYYLPGDGRSLFVGLEWRPRR